MTDNQASPELAFEAVDVHKQYKLQRHLVPVLRDINLRIAMGEWVALVGPSGSGKTTLLHLLGALDHPTAGVIRCRGLDYAAISNRKKASIRYQDIGLVFQAYHLFPELTALENVLLPALRWGTNKRAARQRAADLLESFGLGERLNHRPLELSGGEQQRVALARALINDPDIILADEPTGNLDPDSGGHIIRILADLHRQQRKTIVMVTHDQTLASRADRTLKLVDGRTVS